MSLISFRKYIYSWKGLRDIIQIHKPIWWCHHVAKKSNHEFNSSVTKIWISFHSFNHWTFWWWSFPQRTHLKDPTYPKILSDLCWKKFPILTLSLRLANPEMKLIFLFPAYAAEHWETTRSLIMPWSYVSLPSSLIKFPGVFTVSPSETAIWTHLSTQISSTLALPSPLAGDHAVSYFTVKSEIKQKLPYLPTAKLNDLPTPGHTLCSPSWYHNGWHVPDKSQTHGTLLGRAFQISLSSPDHPYLDIQLTFDSITPLWCLTDSPRIQPFPSASPSSSASLLWSNECRLPTCFHPYSPTALSSDSSECSLCLNINQLTPLLNTLQCCPFPVGMESQTSPWPIEP